MPATAIDLVNNVMEKKPSEFSQNFADMTLDRVRELIAAKRVEVAKNLFGAGEVKEPVVSDETPEVDASSEVDVVEPENNKDNTETPEDQPEIKEPEIEKNDP